MKVIKKIIKRVFFSIHNILEYFEIEFIRRNNKSNVFILGVPLSGNLGDQAIIESERNYLEENFNNFNVIEIDIDFFMNHIQYCKKIIGNNTIYVHGGGYLGTLWLDGEMFFRKVIEVFPNNEIVVFPMTVYFDSANNDILLESQRIYQSHNNIKFFLREKYSYDFMKNNFPKSKIFLVPDMVLYNKAMNSSFNRENVLFCIRNDREKVFYNFSNIQNYVNDKYNYKSEYTDTVLKFFVFKINRKKKLNRKFRQFSKYSLVITDRLHGMVFALLTSTPCLVFENKSYKVLGLYEWIKNIDYIKLYNENTFESDIDNLLRYSGPFYDYNSIKNKYNDLEKTFNLEKRG